MKQLLVLRHAKSSWDNSHLADHDRPLNPRGMRDAPRMGRLLRRERLAPQLIVSSTALRARTTAEEVAEASGHDGAPRLDERLYLAGAGACVELLRELPPEIETAMIVGHNPGLEDLVERLTGVGERFPTAALARIALPIERWCDLDLDVGGELLALWRPKELQELQELEDA